VSTFLGDVPQLSIVSYLVFVPKGSFVGIRSGMAARAPKRARAKGLAANPEVADSHLIY
jgi:hypothetical protein